MKSLFFLLHGDHPTLPAGEVKAILEAEEAPYKLRETLPQVLRCTLDQAYVPRVLGRAYMTRLCAEELFAVEDDPTEILSTLDDALTHHPRIRDGFSLTLHRVQQSAQDIDLKALKHRSVETIRRRTGAEVDAEKPSTSFIGVFSGGFFLFGRLLAETPQKRLIERRPSSRPFFHPAALQPKLAGCMVNLTRVSPGEMLLDPFCGAGSILIEAGLLGCRAVGIDVDPRMVEGSRMNLLHYGVKDFLLRADARRLPMNRVDAVATDPPYGRSATTKGLTPRALLEEFFWSVVELLHPKGYLCAAASSDLGLSDLGGEVGLKVVESHLIRVHGSLTRELAVFRRI